MGSIYTWENSKKDETESNRVNFIAAIANTGYWGRAADGAIQTGKTRGIDVKCLGQTNLDSQKLLDNIEISVNSCVDGIITYGLNQSQNFLKLLEKADEKNIPVVLIDSDVDTENKLCYIGIDDYESGWQAGEEIAKRCERKGQILMIVSDKSVKNQIERLKGFEDAIKQYSNMQIFDIMECGSNGVMAQKMIVKVLEERPDVNAIFCAEGVGTGACCQAMRKKNRIVGKSIQIIGYDYNYFTKEALKKGYLSACIQQDSRQMGELAVEVLEGYLRQGTVPEKIIYTNAVMLLKENIEDGRNIDYGQVKVDWNYY